MTTARAHRARCTGCRRLEGQFHRGDCPKQGMAEDGTRHVELDDTIGTADVVLQLLRDRGYFIGEDAMMKVDELADLLDGDPRNEGVG